MICELIESAGKCLHFILNNLSSSHHISRAKRRNLRHPLDNQAPSTSQQNNSGIPYRRHEGSNIHRLHDNKDSDDENATWNGNSTQQQ